MKKAFFVLHGHLPWVLHFHNKNYEKTWVFEITAECHLRLIEILQWVNRGKVSYSVSPPLLSMWLSDYFKNEFNDYLLKQIYIAEQEYKRNKGTDYDNVSAFYLEFWQNRYNFWQKIDRDIVQALLYLKHNGRIELLTSAASHPILPLLPSNQWINLQIKAAKELFSRVFSFEPKSFWLPECAVSEELLPILEDNGIENIFISEHAANNPASSIFRKGKVNIFLRDMATAERVWSRECGYPGHPFYREYYRDIGWDMPLEQIREYLRPWEFHRFTGFKYFSITDKNNPRKEIYKYDRALTITNQQALEFINFLNQYPKDNIVCIYDAELFGHWWFEGPEWLAKILSLSESIDFTAPEAYHSNFVEKIEVTDKVCSCSWGEKGYFDVWVNEKNEWMYQDLISISHIVERQIDYLSSDEKELLLRLILLLQASDWPFMVYYNSAKDYAHYRYNTYKNDIHSLLENKSLTTDQKEILSFLPGISLINLWQGSKFVISRPTVLLLAWEFPPMTVGGLATHVFYLSKYLQDFLDVHVITRGSKNTIEKNGNVIIHRIALPSYEGQDFINWILLLNLEFTKYIINNFLFNTSQVIIHAHDWLVGLTGITLQERQVGRLIATIHATEHGRQGGIYNEVQALIHHQEASLVKNASEVIACSNYMKQEITTLFGNEAKINVIPNGIEVMTVGLNREQRSVPKKFILFFGRLVPEKGVQTLIDAFAQIQAEYPDYYLLIGGKGYYEETLKSKAGNSKASGKIIFLGFLDNQTRDFLLDRADIVCFPSLYEPFGIVALEAMASGKPVIAGKTGGLSEIIDHGVNGLLFVPGNVEDLIAQLRTFLNNPDFAARCGENAKSNVLQNYSWKNIAWKTYEIYKKHLREENFNEKNTNSY